MGKHNGPIKISLLNVIGEILITAGVILMLFVFWQMNLNDPIVSAKQEQTAKTYIQPKHTAAKPFTTIKSGMKQGKVFARLYVPRFAKTYQRLIGQGTLQAITLNKIGPGHYIQSQWPGKVGNFAIAAHRNSHGAPFDKIDKLTTGDLVFVETNTTWFEYEYRQTKVVDPTDIDVISKVPTEFIGAHVGGKYMTMTSCHPKWTANQRRMVVWLELVAQQPTSIGMPGDLVKLQSQ